MSFKSARSKATNISIETKKRLLERDNHRCIFCKSSSGLTGAHFISRASGGLGIKENSASVCIHCHQRLDHSTERKYMLMEFREYLDKHYPNFTDEERIFDRREWLK